MKYLSIILLGLSLNLFAISPESKEGEALYLEANCQKCHNQGSSFDSKKHKTTNKAELNSWVSSCAGFFDIGWFPEEEQKVQKYLNEEFYHLKQ